MKREELDNFSQLLIKIEEALKLPESTDEEYTQGFRDAMYLVLKWVNDMLV